MYPEPALHIVDILLGGILDSTQYALRTVLRTGCGSDREMGINDRPLRRARIPCPSFGFGTLAYCAFGDIVLFSN